MNKSSIFDASAYVLRQHIMLFDNSRQWTFHLFFCVLLDSQTCSGLPYANTVGQDQVYLNLAAPPCCLSADSDHRFRHEHGPSMCHENVLLSAYWTTLLAKDTNSLLIRAPKPLAL